jgi:hypothetical protein
MRIETLTIAAGEALAQELKDKRALAGTFNLVKRPVFPERYMIVSASGRGEEFRAMTGLDPHGRRVTLLLNEVLAVLMLDATIAPLD